MLDSGPWTACRPKAFVVAITVVALGSMTACAGKSTGATKGKQSYQALSGGEPKLDPSIINAADPKTAPHPLSA